MSGLRQGWGLQAEWELVAGRLVERGDRDRGVWQDPGSTFAAEDCSKEEDVRQ